MTKIQSSGDILYELLHMALEILQTEGDPALTIRFAES